MCVTSFPFRKGEGSAVTAAEQETTSTNQQAHFSDTFRSRVRGTKTDILTRYFKPKHDLLLTQPGVLKQIFTFSTSEDIMLKYY